MTEQSAVEHPIHLPESSLWHKLPLITLIVGVVALGLAAAMAWGTKQFFFSYLVAFCYFLSLAIGGLFFVIVQFATRAGWSVVVRRVAEHLMSTLPLFVPLFIPIAIGLHELYHWTHAEAVSTDPLLTAKSPYLNERGFYFRAAAYFAVWVTLARLFHARSIKQDSSGDVGLTKKMQVLSGPAIALFAFTVTFAAFDWIMSLDPHWYSTMFGPYFFAGAVVSEFALLAVLHILLQRAGGFGQVNAEHYHDLGKLLFGFTVFWAYIAFSQFMLIWYSNIPEETLWYAHRGGPWLGTSTFLAIGHFVVPFFFLLPRAIKRFTPTLFLAASWVLMMHFVDLHWLIMPVLHHHGPHLTAVDALTFVGIGGLFFAAFSWQLTRHALIPKQDPRLRESLAFENI